MSTTNQLRIVKANEEADSDLSGPVDPVPHVGTAGYSWGQYSLSRRSRAGLPDLHLLGTAVALVKEDSEPWVFDPTKLDDFIRVKVTRKADAKVVGALSIKPRFIRETFSGNGALQVMARDPIFRVEIEDFTDGEHDVEYSVNPLYAVAEPFTVTLRFTGEDLEIISPIVWTQFKPA